MVGEGLASPDKKVKIFICKEKRSHFEGTNTPSKGFLLTFCPRRQKVTKNACGERVNAEVVTLCVPTSIACQRYRIPDSPHLRHGRPPRCSLVADSAQIGRIKGKKRVEECFCPFLPQKLVKGGRGPHGGIERLPSTQMLPQNSFTQKFLGVWGLLSRSPQAYPRTPINPNLSLFHSQFIKFNKSTEMK